VSHTLLVSGEAWERYGADITSAAPQCTPFVLPEHDTVAEADLARIDLAYFSGDLYPRGSARFMATCLQAPNLRWLHSFSTGTDHPVFTTFLERGVRLTNSAGSSARPIAQTVAMYLLALSRNLPAWVRAQDASRWEPHEIEELDGQTLAVVGMGPIGTEVSRLGAALGMRVVGCRRIPRGDEPCETWPLDRLDELLGLADWLVLALPLTDDTRGLIDADRLAKLPASARVINVGRGEVVEEAALVSALHDGRLAGAALDVFDVEPLPADSPLWAMPNVLVTPHSSGATQGSKHRATLVFLDNLRRYVNGEDLTNEVVADTPPR
jgi:D-2-hydroxyacid dehydrogenase (NADP+)